MERKATEPEGGSPSDDVDGRRGDDRSALPHTRVSVQSIPFRFTPTRTAIRWQQLGWFVGSFLVVGSVTWAVAYGVSLATVATFLVGAVVFAMSFPLAELRAGLGGN